MNVFFAILVIGIGIWQLQRTASVPNPEGTAVPAGPSPAASILQQLTIKGRAPKTGYARSMFSDGWGKIGTCDVRNYILARDMDNVTYTDNTCKVASGTLEDPYSAKIINFIRGTDTSDDVQIDHVVALGDAWQKGAQQLTTEERYALANDPLNLLAVDGPTNQNKSDSDASTWLPPNKLFRCSYVSRQIAVKKKYKLWVTPAEYGAMATVLANCPNQTLPVATQHQTQLRSHVRLNVSSPLLEVFRQQYLRLA